MRVSIEVELESGVAIMSCSGVFQRDDALQAVERLWATTGWRGEAAVWDFRAARFDVSASDVRQVAQYILKNQPEAPPARVAFLTPNDTDFGLARMFEVFREDPHTAFHVFRDYEAAISWARTSGDGAA